MELPPQVARGRIMFSIAAAAVLFAFGDSKYPPYHRVKTLDVLSAESSVIGDTYYGASGNKIAAYSLPEMKLKWTKTLPSEDLVVLGIASDKNGVCLTARDEDKTELYSLNPVDGKTLWSLTGGIYSEVWVDSSNVYFSIKRRSITAVSRSSHKVKWTFQEPSKPRYPDEEGDEGMFAAAESLSSIKQTVFVNINGVSSALNAETGKRLWSVKESYLREKSFLHDQSHIYIPVKRGTVCRDIDTGRVAWENKGVSYFDGGTVFSDKLLLQDKGQLTWVDRKSGKVIRSLRTGASNMSTTGSYVVSADGKLYYLGVDNAGVISESGDIIWSGNSSFGLGPILWHVNGILGVGSRRDKIAIYEAGPVPDLPVSEEERLELFNQMMDSIQSLDEVAKDQLAMLAVDHYKLVLEQAEKLDGRRAPGRSEILDLLEKTTRPKHTGMLLAAFKRLSADSPIQYSIVDLIAKHGESGVVIPYFIAYLENISDSDKEAKREVINSMWIHILASDDPSAVDFLLRILQDPASESGIRTYAYLSVAKTGKPEAVRTVLGMKKKRKLLDPLEKRMVLERAVGTENSANAMTTVLSQMKGADGREWGLLRSGVLANEGDLFIAERIQGKWTNPLFTGVFTGKVSGLVDEKPVVKKIGGYTADQLVLGSWKEIVRLPQLRKDSDRDGLTDLVENRLGTNPNKADTDGDGDPDEVDPMPTAGRPPRTDIEKIVAAAMEARFHDETGTQPGQFFWDGIEPFEFVGWDGPLIWPGSNRKSPKGELFVGYERGLIFIGVGGDGRHPVNFNLKRDEATVSLSAYRGGLNGDTNEIKVKKFGKEWIVVGMELTSVS